jgi:Ca2+-binding EF-hand superfamily protein
MIVYCCNNIHLNKLERIEVLIAAFQYFDKDEYGHITIDELQQACAEQNMSVIDHEGIEDIIRNVDQDNVCHWNFFSSNNMCPASVHLDSPFKTLCIHDAIT